MDDHRVEIIQSTETESRILHILKVNRDKKKQLANITRPKNERNLSKKYGKRNNTIGYQ
jgi:hypothetical protein